MGKRALPYTMEDVPAVLLDDERMGEALRCAPYLGAHAVGELDRLEQAEGKLSASALDDGPEVLRGRGLEAGRLGDDRSGDRRLLPERPLDEGEGLAAFVVDRPGERLGGIAGADPGHRGLELRPGLVEVTEDNLAHMIASSAVLPIPLFLSFQSGRRERA